MPKRTRESSRRLSPQARASSFSFFVALLFNPETSPPLKFYMPSIQAAASSFAVEASTAPVQVRDEIASVIAAQARSPGGGLLVMPDVFNDANRDLIIALAASSGVPAIYPRPLLPSRAASSLTELIWRNSSAKRQGTSIASSRVRIPPICRFNSRPSSSSRSTSRPRRRLG
jgi:hypothetical protein